jgi:hypothetical protein
MALFDTSRFAESAAGQLLRRIAESGTEGAGPDDLGLTRVEEGALRELGRLGYVTLRNGTGAMSWRLERVVITDAGRAKLAAG